MSKHLCPICKETYTDLGWANSDFCKETINNWLKKCVGLKHERHDNDIGGGFRGLEHVVSCGECKFVYRYDSSD